MIVMKDTLCIHMHVSLGDLYHEKSGKYNVQDNHVP